jgi:uncharacterized protein
MKACVRNAFIFAIVLFTAITGCTKKNDLKPDIVLGKKERIQSGILQESRELWVHVPDEYSSHEDDSARRYPVLYLLDGDAHFYSVVGLMHQLSSVNGNDVCPKMIVVAIPNTNRTRDLTPTHVESKNADSTFFKPSGGGDKFISFLTQEVIPYIENHYPATDDRMLIGHSLGGLMVIHIMMNHSEHFNKYVAIDPSLWWDHHQSLEGYELALKQKKLSGKSLFIGVANTISMDTVQALKDTTERTDHFRSIVRFTRSLKQTQGHRLDWTYRYYGEEGHGSVPLITEYDAFHFLFRKIPIEMKLAQLKTFEGKYRFQFTKGQDSFLQITATADNELLLKELWTGRERKFKPLSETEFYSFDDRFPLKFIMDNNGVAKQILAFNTDAWNKVSE